MANKNQGALQLGKSRDEEGDQLNYQEFSKAELIRHLKSKDKMIETLRESFRVQSKMDKEQITKYRTKLEQEILHNEKAVKSFQSITDTVVEIINKYKFLDQATRESVGNVISGIRDTYSKPKYDKEEEFENENDSQASEFSCIDEIVKETSKLLSYLSKLTDDNVKVVIHLKSELATARDSLEKMKIQQTQPTIINRPVNHIANHPVNHPVNKFNNPVNQPVSQSVSQQVHQHSSQPVSQSHPISQQVSHPVRADPNDEVRGLRMEVDQLVIQKKSLAKLLEQNEGQKRKILQSICTILTDQMIQKLNELSIGQLIDQIKRMTYRIRELQRDKDEMYARNKIDRQQNKKRFDELLKKVKTIQVQTHRSQC